MNLPIFFFKIVYFATYNFHTFAPWWFIILDVSISSEYCSLLIYILRTKLKIWIISYFHTLTNSLLALCWSVWKLYKLQMRYIQNFMFCFNFSTLTTYKIYNVQKSVFQKKIHNFICLSLNRPHDCYTWSTALKLL